MGLLTDDGAALSYHPSARLQCSHAGVFASVWSALMGGCCSTVHAMSCLSILTLAFYTLCVVGILMCATWDCYAMEVSTTGMCTSCRKGTVIDVEAHTPDSSAYDVFYHKEVPLSRDAQDWAPLLILTQPTQDELIETLRSKGRKQAAQRMLRQKREVTHQTTDEEGLSGSVATVDG